MYIHVYINTLSYVYIYNDSVVQNVCVSRKKTNSTCYFIDFDTRVYMLKDYNRNRLID